MAPSRNSIRWAQRRCAPPAPRSGPQSPPPVACMLAPSGMLVMLRISFIRHAVEVQKLSVPLNTLQVILGTNLQAR